MHVCVLVELQETKSRWVVVAGRLSGKTTWLHGESFWNEVPEPSMHKYCVRRSRTVLSTLCSSVVAVLYETALC